MIKGLRRAFKVLDELPGQLHKMRRAILELSEPLQDTSGLDALQARVDDLEARLASVLEEADQILDGARKERRQARNAEERIRTKEAKIEELVESLFGDEEGPPPEPEYADVVPPSDGGGGEEERVSPLHGRLARKSAAKERARAHKYGA